MNDFLKKVLPWIGAAATGGVPALVGMAAREISDVLGEGVAENADDIVRAVSGATPDQIIALKKADQEFAIKMQELGFKQAVDLEKIAADDRANARAREVALRDSTPMILAGVVTVGFFGVLGFMLEYGIQEQGRDALLVMLGALGTSWASVIAYYFGSSAGSARKDQTIANFGK